MGYKDFHKRLLATTKARRIFMPHITKNISTAFAIYQELLADEKMAVFISTAVGGSRPLTPLDDLVRPRCDECGSELRLKINAVDESGAIHPSAWVCENCGLVNYSDKTVKEWLEVLSENR